MAIIYPFMQGLREAAFPAPGKTVTLKSFIPSGTELQALKVKMALTCHADYRWICVTSLKVNETDYEWEKIKNHISGV